MHTSFSGATLETRVWHFACIVLLLGGLGIVVATVSCAIRFLGKDPSALLMLGAAIGWAGAIRQMVHLCFGGNRTNCSRR
jgi:branched-subunit amino acid ABC-type transport system permease component